MSWRQPVVLIDINDVLVAFDGATVTPRMFRHDVIALIDDKPEVTGAEQAYHH